MAAKPKSNKNNKSPSKAKKSKGVNRLTEKQKRFCKEYLKDFNATQAYKRAGYKCSQKSAETSGPRMLENVAIQEYIQKNANKHLEKLDLDAQTIISNIVEIGDRCMEREAVMKFDKEEKAYYHDYLEDSTFDDDGNLVHTKKYLYTFDSRGALKANEMLGKYIGIFNDKIQIDANVSANVNHTEMDLTKLSDEELSQLLLLQEKMKGDEDE
jgi:phage terminase small subunit